MVRTTIDGLAYEDGNGYYWDIKVNPGASVANGLPDCTTFAYGCVLENGQLPPVYRFGSAGSWHTFLTNGWIAVPYKEYRENIKEGDIIEWSKGNHVAVVSSVLRGIKVSGSFYTGIHGKAYYDGKYDTREGINSLQQLGDYFYNKYQYRFFHNTTVEEESKWCGYDPDYVLVSPTLIAPVEKDTSKNQAYVGINGLRIRTEASTNSTIKGLLSVGYYNVEKVTGEKWEDRGKTDDTWYKIGDYYVAGVDGVEYYPAKDYPDPLKQIEMLMAQLTNEIETLKEENRALNNKLNTIRGIVNE